MLDKDTMIKVTNRNSGTTIYILPEKNNLRREFAAGETKELSMDELRALSWAPGGRSLIQQHLIINDKEAAMELLGTDTEPEYFYSEEDVVKLLLNGSVEQLLDCLDFAPEGVLDIIKDQAVKLRLNDVNKRQAIFNKLHFNVTKAIEHDEESSEAVADEVKVRRAAPISTEGAPVRRTAAPVTDEKYKVTTILK